MYLTRIYAAGNGWQGGNGEKLIMAGNLPYKSGDAAWTDGRVIYGWTGRDEPTRQWAYGTGGIPINSPESGLYLFQSQENCSRLCDDYGWLAFANDTGRSFGLSDGDFPYVFDMDVGRDGREWALSGKGAVYVAGTPHHLAWESGGIARPEGNTTVTATWGDTGNITVVSTVDGVTTQQTFREGARRVSVEESGAATGYDVPFTVTHGGMSEARSLKAYAKAAADAFDSAAATRLGKSARLANCVNSMTLALVDGRIDPDGKLSLYILARMRGFAFKDMTEEGLTGSLVKSISSSSGGAGRIHQRWEYTVNVGKHSVEATFCAEFVCDIHLHVDGENVETVFESVRCPGFDGGYHYNTALTEAAYAFSGPNHARNGDGGNWIVQSGTSRTYYSTLYEADIHDGGALNGMVFPETEVWRSSPSLAVSVYTDGFGGIEEESTTQFRMPIQDGFYAVVSPTPIAMTYGRLNASDRQAYLGCFQRVYAPDGKLAADTGAWPLGLLAVRAITPIGEDAYLLQAVSSSEDYTGQVLTYSKEEGLQPVEIPARNGGTGTTMRMASTNTRLRRMRNVGALKRHNGTV